MCFFLRLFLRFVWGAVGSSIFIHTTSRSSRVMGCGSGSGGGGVCVDGEVDAIPMRTATPSSGCSSGRCSGYGGGGVGVVAVVNAIAMRTATHSSCCSSGSGGSAGGEVTAIPACTALHDRRVDTNGGP